MFGANNSVLAGLPTLQVPLPAAILASINTALALAAYVWIPKRHAFGTSLVPFMVLALTLGILCSLTGGVHSPYVPLWMLAAVFSGVFGWYGLSVFTVSAIYAIVQRAFFDITPLERDELIVSIIAGFVPVITSYLVWHEKGRPDTGKRLEALSNQLSQVANKSDIVINSIADGVLAIDEKGQVQLVNPAAQTSLGWSNSDALGLDYHSVFRLGDHKGNELANGADPIQQVFITGKTAINNLLTLSTKSGKRIDISLVVSPVPMRDASKIGGAIAVFRDVTEEKREERAQGEFISTAAHEMRTPVAAIEGYLGLALNPATAAIDDKARSYLLKAHESTQHLGRLFQDLLTVSRAEDGRLVPKPVVIDIINFVHEIVDSLAPKAQTKGLTLQFTPVSGSGEIGAHNLAPAYFGYLDRDHLREVINNLVDNAIKYTKQGGVALDVTGSTENITISITDSGIGIPPEDLPHLFQKFYRVDESYTREVGGTGLGLYICRRLIENNSGKIWAESTYGKGSTFFIQVPRITHEKASQLQDTAAIGQTAAVPAANTPVRPRV